MKILSQQVLESVYSASGITPFDSGYLVVGDNSPHLFELQENLTNLRFHPIPEWEVFQNEVIPKPIKPDFEAIETVSVNGKDEIWIFGSGSLSPTRDHMLRIWKEVGNFVIKKKDLTDLYADLRQTPELAGSYLNIEALAILNEQMLLFNRGKNLVWHFHFPDFCAFLNENTSLPKFETQEMELPTIRNHTAQITGACFSNTGASLLLTATVENTNNPIDDGEVLGSFVGQMKVKNSNFNSKIHWEPIVKHDVFLPLKVESICPKNGTDDTYLLVTDSDGGPSELLVIQL